MFATDPSSALSNKREEEIPVVPKMVTPAPVKTSSRTATSSGNSTPHHQVEEKVEPQPVRTGAKRQRRQRTHHDSVSKDDDKKVGLSSTSKLDLYFNTTINKFMVTYLK